MTIVIGTAGHIDHGKTALLHALTGIDADRLPEERRRGMTIDVGYAHLGLPDGDVLDFVDVPGHDRLIGNMLVGAGEVDAAMLVVAADDGPRAQTLEHLELLDAIGIEAAVAVVSKLDLLDPDDPREGVVAGELATLLGRTRLAGTRVVGVSALTGVGIEDLRAALLELRDRVRERPGFGAGPTRLAIDRAFAVRGRGVVVTGSLRGGVLVRGAGMRIDPGGHAVRIRELQVHGETVEHVSRGGRVALNLAGVDLAEVRRGMVLSEGPAIEPSDRLLVALRPAVRLRARSHGRDELAHRARVRLHAGTDAVEATIDRGLRAGADLSDGFTAILRLDAPVAVAFGDRFVLRRTSPGETLGGGTVLDPRPPRGISRRRAAPEALIALGESRDPHARLEALLRLHAALPPGRIEALAAASTGLASAHEPSAPDGGSGPMALPNGARRAGPVVLEAAIADALERAALAEVASRAAADALSSGTPTAELRASLARHVRRLATVERGLAHEVAGVVIATIVEAGRLDRDGDRVHESGRSPGLPPALAAAMDRLHASLAVAAPPPLSEAARAARCPPEGIRALEAAGRIVRVEADLAWASTTFRELESLAIGLAARGPLAPSTFRDATGTSRRFALAILEDLDRRGVLRRTPAGHLPGPNTPASGTRP